MVEVRPTGRGDEVVEVAPQADQHGHAPVYPGWTGCPHCRWGLRIWRCSDGHCDGIVYDPQHECRESPPG